MRRIQAIRAHTAPAASTSAASGAASVSPAFRLAQPSPNPYVPGQRQAPPFPCGADDFVEIESQPGFDPNFYKVFISSLVPRCVALVSTRGPTGVSNLAPYSFFNGMAFDPPIVVFGSIARRNLPGGMSDTHRNLVETGECVVQIISEWYAEAANHSTGAFEYTVDEIQAAGLTTLPTTPKLTSGVPRIAEAAVQMECTLDHLVPIKNDEGQVTSTICVCRVQTFHVNRAVYDKAAGVVDVGKLRPIARLGGDADVK